MTSQFQWRNWTSIFRNSAVGGRTAPLRHNLKILAWAAAAFAVAAPLAAGRADAGENAVDFEDCINNDPALGYPARKNFNYWAGRHNFSIMLPAPSSKEATACAKVTATSDGNIPDRAVKVTFNGGQILTNTTKDNPTSVYASGKPAPCVGCGQITITFSEPVSEISMQVLRRRAIGSSVRIWHGNKYFQNYNVVFGVSQSIKNITLPPRFSDVSKLSFGVAHGLRWGVGIDNIKFKTKGGKEYVISLSAFVPHDNVPGGPTASCLVNNKSWLSTSLNRRFARAWAANGGVELPGRKRRIYFAGDGRGFEAGAPTYRLRQQLTVIPDEMSDADGVKDDIVNNLAGEVRAFAADAMADGVIDAADEDGVAGDCKLFHKAYLAETDGMKVGVTRTGPQSLEVSFKGTLDSPLVGPAQVLGAIDWNFKLNLDATVEPARWTLSGAHDGFPAYEIYVNGEAIYQHDPGPPPYKFAEHLRKLLPPLDTGVSGISGVLQ